MLSVCVDIVRVTLDDTDDSSITGGVSLVLSLPSSTNCNQKIPEEIPKEDSTIKSVPRKIHPKSPIIEPELVRKARRSISRKQEKKVSIELCEEGVGGTYFIHDDHDEKLAIFKPTDEEPGSPNNPKKKLTKPLLPPGGGAKREVAAYLIDRGRAGVPETHFLHDVKHPALSNGKGHLITKSGSVQKFVPNIGDCNGTSPSRFQTSDVHNIGILDIRLFNMDRNSENILVQKTDDVYRLIPIDHTYTLPPKLDSAWFEWQYWKQAKQSFSEDTRKYIADIDIEKDAEILGNIGIEEASIRTMKIATTLLKIGSSEGLNLFEIASMICPKLIKQPSELEELVKIAENNCENDNEFMDQLALLVKESVTKKRNIS